MEPRRKPAYFLWAGSHPLPWFHVPIPQINLWVHQPKRLEWNGNQCHFPYRRNRKDKRGTHGNGRSRGTDCRKNCFCIPNAPPCHTKQWTVAQRRADGSRSILQRTVGIRECRQWNRPFFSIGRLCARNWRYPVLPFLPAFCTWLLQRRNIGWKCYPGTYAAVPRTHPLYRPFRRRVRKLVRRFKYIDGAAAGYLDKYPWNVEKLSSNRGRMYSNRRLD